MKTNVAKKVPVKKEYTHGGGEAVTNQTALAQLKRSVFACLLWENNFYEDGQSIALRIRELCKEVSNKDIALIAEQARVVMQLRHVPLLLTVELARKRYDKLEDLVDRVIKRADEMGELLSLYWADGKKPIPAGMKRGLARAFLRFDAYQLAKYNRDGAIKLRDIMRLVHPKPVDQHQALLFKQLLEGDLASPDTWEVELSAGKDKKATFERLLSEGKLGYMALLRNLRNMEQAGVDRSLVATAIADRKGAHRVLPMRYITASKHAPRFEKELDQAMIASMAASPKLKGKTLVVVDISGSMQSALSSKSELSRLDAACALASIISGSSEECVVYATAGNDGSRRHATDMVPPRSGMAMVEAIKNKKHELGGGGIFLNQVCKYIAEREKSVDRMIVITDEQDCSSGHEDSPKNANPLGIKNYMLNVNTDKPSIAYGKWVSLTGFSDNILKYIAESEAA